MLTLYLSLIDTQEERDKFERLFHQYERCLKYTAQNILFDEHLAEDAVQETFIRIISCLDKIDESDEHNTFYEERKRDIKPNDPHAAAEEDDCLWQLRGLIIR